MTSQPLRSKPTRWITPIATLLAALLAEQAPLSGQTAAPATSHQAIVRTIKGPWGNILAVPFYLEAPPAMMEAYPLPNSVPRWSFPESAASNLSLVFANAGLPATLLNALSQPSSQIREGGFIHVFPPAQEVLNLTPESRARLYLELAKYPVNEFHHDPVLILTDTVEEWYRSSGLRPELIEAISKMSYRRGEAWAFSDVSLILNLAANEAEARTLFRAFTRTRTYLLKLIVDADLDSTSVRNYWSLGGKSFRLKALEPLLESLKETGQRMELDICHVIPPLPRKLMYNYPGESYLNKGILPDCHWTSLNFFNYEPHEYLLDPRLATNRVLDGYATVEPPYQYGDVLFFIRNADGDAFHSCVYLADDLVFTKNGRNQLAPWIITTIEDVSRIYLSITDGRIQGYRRKDGFKDASN